MVDSHPIPFNRRATRWLGIYLGSRLRFAEHVSRSAARARTAEKRLRSIVTRHGVPPITPRHLQGAIVSSTLMYGSEITWKGQRGMETVFRKNINRMARASLGVVQSTQIAFCRRRGGRCRPSPSQREGRAPLPRGWLRRPPLQRRPRVEYHRKKTSEGDGPDSKGRNS